MPDVDQNANAGAAAAAGAANAAAVASVVGAGAAPAGDSSVGDAGNSADAAGATLKGGAPTYTDFAMAEGVEIDAGLLGEFKGVAGELKLDQAGAQKVVDLGAKMVKTFGERQAAALKAEVAKWTEASKNDPEFGGAKFAESQALANKVLASFGSPNLTALLTESGLSQNPDVIRLLVKVGAVVSEDKFVPASNRPNGQRNPGDYRFMYPNSQHN